MRQEYTGRTSLGRARIGLTRAAAAADRGDHKIRFQDKKEEDPDAARCGASDPEKGLRRGLSQAYPCGGPGPAPEAGTDAVLIRQLKSKNRYRKEGT